MGNSIQAALQLYQHNLTPIPLIGKRPILKNWTNRFIETKIQPEEIINGIVDTYGNLVTFEGKNIGIITGQISNVIVLDFDDLTALTKLKKIGDLPPTWTVRSNRGLHLYFNYDARIPSMKLWDNIDILSDRKQVVAPPSIHPSGTVYSWYLSPTQINKANLPEWLIEYLLQLQYNGNYKFNEFSGEVKLCKKKL